MSTIDEIKDRIDIVDVVSETVQLRRSGKNYTGFCPFHSNTRTPAFVVFPETSTWRCFGQCNEGGDVFGFLMKKEGWDFGEALRYLADRAGVELRPLTPQEQATVEEHEHLRNLLEDAVTYYRHTLFNTPEGKPVLEYLHHERGLSDETIEAFGLGYARDSWEDGLKHFESKGYKQVDLLACGLASERESDDGTGRAKVYDRFRHRIMIPIRDERGRMAGFGARIVNPDDVPKFLNSPLTVLFDKGRLLYGLDRARKEIRVQDQVVIVEGYLDVIALHQSGFSNTVSPMGTALTEHQLRILKRFTRRMVLALDADAAGNKATLRGLQVARQALDRESDPIFDARGLLRNEARLKADIRVTTLPLGLDPDEIVLNSAEQWDQIVAEACPIVAHVMQTLAKEQDIEDPKVKSQIANQVLPLIEDIPDSVERDAYRQQLARLLKVDERAILEMGIVRPGRKKTQYRIESSGEHVEGFTLGGVQPPPAPGLLEAYCLSVLIRHPDLVYMVDRALQASQLSRLSGDDFRSADHQVLFRLIEDSLKQDHIEPLLFVQNNLSLHLMEYVDQLLLQTEELDPNENKVLEDLVRMLLVLRQYRLHQEIDHIRYLLEEAQLEDNLRIAEYLNSMKQYIDARAQLDRALGLYTSHMVQ